MNHVLTSNLTPSYKIAYVCMAQHTDQKGRLLLQQQEIEQLYNLGSRTLSRAIKRLAKEGFASKKGYVVTLL